LCIVLCYRQCFLTTTWYEKLCLSRRSDRLEYNVYILVFKDNKCKHITRRMQINWLVNNISDHPMSYRIVLTKGLQKKYSLSLAKWRWHIKHYFCLWHPSTWLHQFITQTVQLSKKCAQINWLVNNISDHPMSYRIVLTKGLQKMKTRFKDHWI
jgi:hypothetical protein